MIRRGHIVLAASLGASVALAGVAYAATLGVTSERVTSGVGDARLIAHVKGLGTSSCGSTGGSVTVPAAGVAQGHTIIVRVGYRDSATGAISASDSRGNTYTVDRDVLNSGIRSVVLSAHVTTALQSGDTVSATWPTGPNGVAMAASEYTGILNASRVDVSAAANGDGTPPSVSATTTNDVDLLYGAVAQFNNRTWTEASGWTTDQHVAASCGGAPGNLSNRGAFRVTTATGAYTYNPVPSANDRWAAALVAYKDG